MLSTSIQSLVPHAIYQEADGDNLSCHVVLIVALSTLFMPLSLGKIVSAKGVLSACRLLLSDPDFAHGGCAFHHLT